MRQQQTQKTDAQENNSEQNNAAQPLMAGEAGIGSFNLAALLIQFWMGTRHNTLSF